MSLESCIFGCTQDAAVYGCRWHWPVHPADPQKQFITLLSRIIQNQEKIMTALTDLQGADTSLQASVAKLLTDYAAALAAAAGDPTAIESVVTDMNSMAAQLNAADASITGTGTSDTTPTPAPVTPEPVTTDGTGTDTTTTPAS